MMRSRDHLTLTEDEQALVDGEAGPGIAMAARLVVRLAQAMGAPRLLPITGAHIDSCLYHGPASIDFVHALSAGAPQVRVPTTLNVSSLDLLHPELFQGSPELGRDARTLMDAYVALGCEPTWTCAPYQDVARPALGEHVAWAESNAIVFANSVLGARTHRYGDFIDIAAALVARVPDAGLHRDENRRATLVLDVTGLPDKLRRHDGFFPLLGLIVGKAAGQRIPAIVGLDGDTTEDQLKALGAAAASSGGIAMFHAVGITPEAPDLVTALSGHQAEHVDITVSMVETARADFGSAAASDTPITTVSVGTPHYSVDEIERLNHTFADASVDPRVAFYVSTSRSVLMEAQLRGLTQRLETAGVQFVTDTCTYITPIVCDTTGLAMTDSAKWAYYAPGNIGVDAVLGTLSECVESAVSARLVRHQEWWK